jgi:rod shape-determining protein MreC
MHQIISFFVRYKYFILFIVLELIAFSLTIQSHSYHRSKFINSSNYVTGFFYNQFNVFDKRTTLKKYSKELAEENTRLKNFLVLKNGNKISEQFNKIDSLIYHQNYTYINAIIIDNEFNKSVNVLTLNKGKKDSVVNDLGVINSKGIVGIVSNSSTKYATVMSILNENSKINSRLKKNNHFGTLVWNAKDYKTIQFEDLPRQANIKIGDTVITDGKSTIFPEGILIGSIKDFKIINNNYEIVNVTLFNDMSALKHVNIVVNLDKEELEKLKNTNE